MDPLTVVSSVASTIQLVENISRFILDFKDAGRTASELSVELRGLQHVISQIQTLDIGKGAFQHDSSSATLMRSLEGCRQILQELEQKQGIDTKSHRFSSRFRGLANPSRQRDTERLIQSLHNHQQELQLLLTIQLVQASSRINTQLSQTGPATPTENPSSNILSLPEPGLRAVLDWLTTFDYQSRHSELIRVRAPHTGRWFTESSEFKAWLSGQHPGGTRHRPSNVLWCNGVPGSGKSVLMATAVRHILELAKKDPGIGVAYFYFDYKTKAAARDVISCFIRQLCLAKGLVPRPVQQLYDRYSDQDLSRSWETLKNRKGPETGELGAALLDMTSEFRQIVFCIDGLDECAPEFQITLTEVIQRIMKSRCRLLITSRDDKAYRELFHGKPKIRVTASLLDVQSYVNQVLNDRQELREMIDDTLKIQIAQTLSEKARGLFIFVYLCMQGLLEQTCVSELRSALQDMPSSLDDVYNGILQRIKGQSSSKSKLAMRIFMWLSYCERSLTIKELQHAVAIDPTLDAEELDVERIPPARLFEEVCMDLVTVDKDRNVVLLAHASLSQYLAGLRLSHFPRGPRDLAYTMLTYLNFAEFSSGPCDLAAKFRERLDRYPLAVYVSRYWGDHIRDYWHGRVQKGIMLFLQDEQRRMSFVQIMYAANTQGSGSHQDYPKGVTGLQLAAHFGIDMATRLFLEFEEGTSLAQTADSWGRTPLHSACEKCRSLSIVKALLAHGAPVDAVDSDGKAAIHLAAQAGNVPIVLELLSHGADPARPDHNNRSAFDYAAADNHPKLITELLNHSPDGSFSEGNSLLAAATAGHGSIVELLLDCGIEHQEVEALLKAAELGFEEIVRILLEHGADLNSKDAELMTALHYASAHGRTSMVRLLLTNGSNVTAKNEDGRTALFLAAERGDEPTLKVLTEYGAEIEARNDEGKTALFECAENGNIVGVDFLLRRGATMSSSTSSASSTSNGLQVNALQIAAKNGHVGVVRLLLQKNPDPQGTSQRTVISYAVEGGQMEVVKFLLETGIDVDATDENSEHLTALAHAAEAGETDIAKLLMESGARVDFPLNLGRTCLYYAIHRKHEGMVRLLVERGADVNWKDESGVTPLHYAVQCRVVAIVKLLIGSGADPFAKDKNGYTPADYVSNDAEIETLLQDSLSRTAPRSATFTVNESPTFRRPSAVSSRSEAGTRFRRRPSKPIFRSETVSPIPARYVTKDKLLTFLRELFPNYQRGFQLRLEDENWIFVAPRGLTEDEIEQLTNGAMKPDPQVLVESTSISAPSTGSLPPSTNVVDFR